MESDRIKHYQEKIIDARHEQDYEKMISLYKQFHNDEKAIDSYNNILRILINIFIEIDCVDYLLKLLEIKGKDLNSIFNNFRDSIKMDFLDNIFYYNAFEIFDYFLKNVYINYYIFESLLNRFILSKEFKNAFIVMTSMQKTLDSDTIKKVIDYINLYHPGVSIIYHIAKNQDENDLQAGVILFNLYLNYKK